jgi:signal peptidase
MSPLLTTGDVVAVKKGVAFEDLWINEIIVFKDLVPIKEESVIISRINEILLDPNDDIVFVTKGDANSASIPGVDFPIYKDNFVGRVSCFFEDGQLKR